MLCNLTLKFSNFIKNKFFFSRNEHQLAFWQILSDGKRERDTFEIDYYKQIKCDWEKEREKKKENYFKRICEQLGLVSNLKHIKRERERDTQEEEEDTYTYR